MQKPSANPIAAAIIGACLTFGAAQAARADITYYSPPKFNHQVLPVYSEAANAAHETGQVIIKVLVGTDGKPKQFIVFKSSGHKDLDDAVITAAKASTYYPAMRGSSPQVAFFDVTYKFTLQGVAENEGNESDLSKKVDANPKDVSSRIQLGTDYLNQHQYAQAESTFSDGTAQVPNNARLWELEGIAYFQDAQANSNDPDKFKSSVDAFDRALALNPKIETIASAASANFNWGFHLQQSGDTAGALPFAQKAIQLDGTQSAYYILLGEVQTSQANYQDAIATLKKAESLDKKSNSLVTSRIIADEGNAELMQGDKVDGMADINRAEQADGQAAFPYIYLFSYYNRTGNRQAAMSPLQQLAKLQPKDPQWQLEMGNMYLSENNAAAARTAFQNAVALDPNDPNAQFGMAELAATTGDTQSIASTMAKISAGADPKSLAGWNATLAIMLINASQGGKSYWTDAQNYATQATKEDPTNGQGWFALGYSQYHNNDKDDASASIKKAYDIFKSQNNADSMKQADDIYKQITGSDIAGYSSQ